MTATTTTAGAPSSSDNAHNFDGTMTDRRTKTDATTSATTDGGGGDGDCSSGKDANGNGNGNTTNLSTAWSYDDVAPAHSSTSPSALASASASASLRPSVDELESTFGPSFSFQDDDDDDAPIYEDGEQRNGLSNDDMNITAAATASLQGQKKEAGNIAASSKHTAPCTYTPPPRSPTERAVSNEEKPRNVSDRTVLGASALSALASKKNPTTLLFKEGQQVLYRSQGVAAPCIAVINKVHYAEELSPYYTIDLNGRERQTTEDRLSLFYEADDETQLSVLDDVPPPPPPMPQPKRPIRTPSDDELMMETATRQQKAVLEPKLTVETSFGSSADEAVPIAPNEEENKRWHQRIMMCCASSSTKPKLFQKSKFISTLLFIIGSILYLIMAIEDYHWAHTLNTLPMFLRVADDDLTWVNYRLEERYDAEQMAAANGASASGGVRKMLMKRSLKAEDGEATPTPEELYYNLEWAQLPEDIQEAYKILGFDEDSWDNGDPLPETEDHDWSELSAFQMGAAMTIGYTEEIWCSDGGCDGVLVTDDGGEGDQVVEEEGDENENDEAEAETTVVVSEDTGEEVEDATLEDSAAGSDPNGEEVSTEPEVSDSSANIDIFDGENDQPTSVVSAVIADVESSAPEEESSVSLSTAANTDTNAAAAATDPMSATTPIVSQPTPEEMYYDLAWMELPTEIQTAYELFGFDENSWDAGILPETEDYDWIDLSDEQREAALFIGYTEEIWCDLGCDAYLNAGAAPVVVDTMVVQAPAVVDSTDPVSSPTPAAADGAVQNIIQSPTSPVVDLSLEEGSTSTVQAADSTPVQAPANNDILDEVEDGQQAINVPVVVDASSAANTSTTTGVADPALATQPASSTPESMYYNLAWAELPAGIQRAYAKLGFDQNYWDNAILPETEDYDWIELSEEQRDAAMFIGYTEAIWCNLGCDAYLNAEAAPGVAVSSVPDVIVTNHSGFKLEFIPPSSSGTTSDITTGTTTTPTATGHVGYYDDYDWVEMPPDVQEAATVLGYDQKMWDMGGLAWSEDYFWDELTPEAREAAALLKYDRYTWDGIDPVTGAALSTAAGDDYVSYDDDYVFEVKSLDDVWVSKYQILYFFAALSFVFVGILDLIRERHVFHIMMILAGVFGVASAVYVEEDIRLSNILNCVSVHFYLLEAFSLAGYKRHYVKIATAGSWTKRSIMVGDLEFFAGSLIDVILSYLYLFDHTADWDVPIQIVLIFAAVLWLHCSLVYMGAFLYEYYQANLAIEGEGNTGSDDSRGIVNEYSPRSNTPTSEVNSAIL